MLAHLTTHANNWSNQRIDTNNAKESVTANNLVAQFSPQARAAFSSCNFFQVSTSPVLQCPHSSSYVQQISTNSGHEEGKRPMSVSNEDALFNTNNLKATACTFAVLKRQKSRKCTVHPEVLPIVST